MPWLWMIIVLSVVMIVVVTVTMKRENLTMLSESKQVDGWGNVTLTP